jgi:hypothetical protein
MARNPKDVAVSYYYFESGKPWSGNYAESWEHWLKMFVAGAVQRGDWFDHVLGWWRHRAANNLLFLKYEDLQRHYPRELQRIAAFLGYSLAPETLAQIIAKTSFERMQQDRFSNMHEIESFRGFFREGRIGSWKDQFTAAQSLQFDRLCEERFKGSGLNFEFE